MNPIRWLAARLRRADSFVGPPLPPGARRFNDGQLYRQVSRWNKDYTLHTISFVALDGQPRARRNNDLGDFELPEVLRRVADS